MRKLKKIIAAILAAAVITTCTPITTPSVSYAADAADYTSAIDIEMNQINMVTIEGTKSTKDKSKYAWYRFHASPKTEIQLVTTQLEGSGIVYRLYDSSLKYLDYCSGTNSLTKRLGTDTTYYIRITPSSNMVKGSFIVKGTEATEASGSQIAMPSMLYVSDTVSSTDYTLADDIELNKINIITAENTNQKTINMYAWYKFQVNPGTEIEIINTTLYDEGIYFYLYDSSLQQIYSRAYYSSNSETIKLEKDTTYYIRIDFKDIGSGVTEKSAFAVNVINTVVPDATPTIEPTVIPTIEPTATPTIQPTATPTIQPTATPTIQPTATPTIQPTATPTIQPTATPTIQPTATPTIQPTATPAIQPTTTPTIQPTVKPTVTPTVEPTIEPTAIPANDTDFWTEDENTGSGVYDEELPVPEIKEAGNSKNSINIVWSCSDTSDIDGYYIYRSNNGKTWTKIATINDTEINDYEDTDVTNGTGYGYIMRSYVGNSQSENSIPEYTYFLDTTSIKSVKSKASKKLTVKWNTNSKASGYQIRISTTKSFTKTTTETKKVNSKSKNTKTVSKLKGGKKYFVQIRAYRSYNGEIYYSEWSTSKSLKVKR